MVQRTWTNVELSAYVDGRLSVEQRAALEAALGQDAELRRQVDGLRQVKAMLRDLPLVEPPRNYLLTPGMVRADLRKGRVQQPAPLRAFRWATALMTAAFAVTLSLNLLVRVPSPVMMTASVERLAYSAAPAPQLAPEAESTTVEVLKEMAVEEQPTDAETEEQRLFAAPAPLPEGTPTGSVESADVAASDENGLQPTSGEPAPAEAAAASSEVADQVAQAEAPAGQAQAAGSADMQPLSTRPLLPLGVPIALGSLAAIAAATTLWLSRRR